MDREKTIFFRNLFLRAFVISLVLALLLFGATMAFWSTAARLTQRLFQVDEKELGRIVLVFFTNVRIVILFLFLAPALALHWTARKQ
jgi:hypothetical protein